MLDIKDEQILYVVKYSGPFGFIKPWTAVRDGETYSQQFLTQSIIEGIKQKLNVNGILRHRLTYSSMALQQEVTQPRAWEYKIKKREYHRNRSIIRRGVLVNPDLYLAFGTQIDAEKAYKEHICLARNEDVLLPVEKIMHLTADQFNKIQGFELQFGIDQNSVLVGYNRFNNNEPMYGTIYVTDQPIKE